MDYKRILNHTLAICGQNPNGSILVGFNCPDPTKRELLLQEISSLKATHSLADHDYPVASTTREITIRFPSTEAFHEFKEWLVESWPSTPTRPGQRAVRWSRLLTLKELRDQLKSNPHKREQCPLFYGKVDQWED